MDFIMGKKVKILILMGMTISLLSCSIIEENSRKNIDIATNVEEMEVVESEEVIQEDIEEIKREIKAIDLTPNININLPPLFFSVIYRHLYLDYII